LNCSSAFDVGDMSPRTRRVRRLGVENLVAGMRSELSTRRMVCYVILFSSLSVWNRC
jgi:hypothetical protein